MVSKSRYTCGLLSYLTQKEISELKIPLIRLIFISLFLLACQSQDEAISFSIFGDPAEYKAYQNLVTAFEDAHPDIKIALRHIPSQSEYRRRLATDFSSGDPAHIVLLNYRRFAAFAQQDVLEPLGPYLAQSNLIDEADFYAPAIQSFYWQNKLWCVPQNISSLVVYYNKNLFDKAGLPYPHDEWTWADFLTTAQALTLDNDSDGQAEQYGAGIAPNIFRLAPFIWQNDGLLVDDPSQPSRLALDSPEVLEALSWFVALQTEAGVVPDKVAEIAESSEGRFLGGRLGMYFNSRRGVPTYREINTFTWDVAPLPQGLPLAQGTQKAGILHSDAYCMAATTPNKPAAWTFIEFANSVEGQSLIAASGRTVPSLKAVAESPAFLNPNLPPANSHVFLDTIPILKTVPIMTTWPGIEETVSKEIERAFYGQASLETVVETALRNSQPFFDKDALAP